MVPPGATSRESLGNRFSWTCSSAIRSGGKAAPDEFVQSKWDFIKSMAPIYAVKRSGVVVGGSGFNQWALWTVMS